jgi:cyclopropane fatty-acyl-phospholipid synthase-like methyltransferase
MSKTENFFNEYSVGFDSIYGDNALFKRLINKYLRKCMRIRFEKTIEGCKPLQGKSVLDIGCGPGHYSICLALRGAEKVLGVDFAEKMIQISRDRAKQNKISDKCSFEVIDFNTLDENEKFSYTIVMGFMDYMDNPKQIITKVVNLTSDKAFFSFPCSEGFLAWQRKIRYKFKCPLYLYSQDEVKILFANIKCKNVDIEKIGRDYFVTVTK